MEHLYFLKQLNKKRSNRGAALVTVLIVTTIVSVLGIMSLSAAYTSFRMKAVDRDSTEVFYATEKILEEIAVKLQDSLTDSHNYAYSHVMTMYESYEDPVVMKQDYERLYMEHLQSLMDQDGDNCYDLVTADENLVLTLGTILQSMIVSYTDEDVSTSVNIVSADGLSRMDVIDNSLVLRELSVTYTVEGLVSQVTTDIRLDVPDVTFSVYSKAPVVDDYALIAGNGIQVTGNADITISGKTNVGLLDDDLYYKSEDNYSIVLETGATLIVDNSEFTTQGTIELFDGAAFGAGTAATLWTHGINTHATTGDILTETSNNVTLLGTTYVKDDITINGTGNLLRLGGSYFGYSDGVKMTEYEDGTTTEEMSADVSSAIIINGRDTFLDLSDLETLVLAGTAFVGTKAEYIGTEENPLYSTQSDVLMGDSFAIKSNQLIYMVPTECEEIKSNPMTYDQYLELQKTLNWQDKALATVIPGLGRSISSYGDVEIVPVFTNRSGGGVYLYIQFEDVQSASAYFMDNYGNTESGLKAEEFLKNYVKAFNVDSTTNAAEVNILSAGNYLQEAGDGYFDYESSTGEIDKLNLDGAYEDLVYSNQFDDVVRESVINGDLELSAGLVKFMVVDNEEGTEYTVPSDFKGILIATGDVKVTSNANSIQGLILCKGKLNVVGSGMNLKNNQEYIAQALELVSDSGVSAKNFFKGYYHVSSGSNGDSAVTDIRQCVTFENWRTE